MGLLAFSCYLIEQKPGEFLTIAIVAALRRLGIVAASRPPSHRMTALRTDYPLGFMGEA